MITIWGRPNSHNVKKVLWLAEELGLDFVRHDVGGSFGYPEDYTAKNPNRLVPTLEDGELVLWESNAILRYLAAQYGGEAFWPSAPTQRALGDKWMDWQFTLADAQRDAFLGMVRTTPDDRDNAAIKKSLSDSARLFGFVEHALTQTPWLSGDTFGIGDIPLGVYVRTFAGIGGDTTTMPHLQNWYKRLQQRPGYACHVMIPLT